MEGVIDVRTIWPNIGEAFVYSYNPVEDLVSIFSGTVLSGKKAAWNPLFLSVTDH